MAAATAQGTYINPMTALAAGQLPHALNGMPNPVVPPTSGKFASDYRELGMVSDTRDLRGSEDAGEAWKEELARLSFLSAVVSVSRRIHISP